MKKILFFIVALGVTSIAAEYHVSPAGNDDSGTGSAGNPFQTIAKANSLVLAGDTCILHAGTYREAINPAQSGTAAQPITYQSAGDGDVILNGTAVITGWTQHQQINGIWIWKAAMSTNLHRGTLRNQILADGIMMPEARWPNLSNWVDGEGFDLLDSSQLAVAAVPYNSNAVAQIQVPDANQPDNFWAGGFVWADIGARWLPDMAKIVASTSGSLTISNKSPIWFPQNDSPGPQGNSGGLYISGTMAALDAPGEWYYDAADQLLYLIPIDGTDPNSHRVEARTDVLENLINLTQNWIVVDGVNCVAGAGQIISTNCTVQNCSFNYISHELTSNRPTDPDTPVPPNRGGGISYNGQIGGLYISGISNGVVRCRFNKSSSNGINLSGTNNTVSHCLIQNVDYNGDYSSGVSMRGNQCTVEYCTITRAGRTLIEPRGKQDMIHHNDLSWGMLYSNDGGAIYTISTSANGTDISYNRIHDIRTWSLDATIRSYLQAGRMPGAQLNTSVHCGIYLDAVCGGYNLHHNLIWNCTEGINVHAEMPWGKPHGAHRIFNNTEWNLIETGSGIKSAASVTNIFYWNNLSQFYNFNGAIVVSNYPTVLSANKAPDPGFVSVSNLDFRLNSTCALINAGTTNLVPYDGYVYTYNGSAPDLGAFEYGEEPWVAGTIAADFTATPKVGVAPLEVSFTDTSIGNNITNLLWDFGDGQTVTSAAGATVTHTYTTNGTYTVSLTASGATGTSTETKWAFVTLANTPPVAQFTATPASGVAPLTVTFTDDSSGGVVRLQWLFGDGQSTNTAAGAVVTHDYPVGTYTASLVAMGPFGTNTLTKTISVATNPNASMIFDFDDPASISSKTYTFSHLTGKPTASAGTVSGSVTDAANMGTETFSMTVTSVANWDNAAAQAYPAGVQAYLASLTPGPWGGNVTGVGPDVGTNLCFDTLGEALVCTFNLSGLSPEHQAAFRLKNWAGSNLQPTDFWDWAVIDTSSGTLAALSSGVNFSASQYAMSAAAPAIGHGDVFVLAYKTNSAASNKKLTTLSFNILPVQAGPPAANFVGTPASGTAPLTVTFSDASTGTITNHLWTFGDGQTSNASGSTVLHTYTSPGTYTVSLRVTGPEGTDTQTRSAYITVNSPYPPITKTTWKAAVSGDWLTRTNWSSGAVPLQQAQNLKVLFSENGAQECVLNTNATVAQLSMGDGGTTNGNFLRLVRGANLYCGINATNGVNWTAIGYNRPATLTVETGAVFRTAANLLIGPLESGTSRLNIRGGTVNIGTTIALGNANNLARGLITVEAGGLLTASSMTINTTGTVIDVRGGTIVLTGNQTNTINTRIASGIMTAYGGAGVFTVDYNTVNAGKTTISSYLPTGYDEWVDSIGVEIGAPDADYDSDDRSNFYEYTLNGSPTNSLNSGVEPSMTKVGADFQYRHVRRTNDSSLTYTVETRTNLISGIWTNTGYTILATNVLGGNFDEVIYSVASVTKEMFIRLIIMDN